MSAADRDALREAAEKATPGPWSAGTIYSLVSPSQIDGFIWPREREQEVTRIRSDCGFIAAADPPTVLALLDALAAAEARADRAEKDRDDVLAAVDEKWRESDKGWAVESMRLSDVLALYRDGDEHGWTAEFDRLWSDQASRMDMLATSIQETGITVPILLGTDGRVWDGHHRLAVAHRLGIARVPVERADAIRAAVGQDTPEPGNNGNAQLEALMRVLINDGHMTPVAERQILKALR